MSRIENSLLKMLLSMVHNIKKNKLNKIDVSDSKFEPQRPIYLSNFLFIL